MTRRETKFPREAAAAEKTPSEDPGNRPVLRDGSERAHHPAVAAAAAATRPRCAEAPTRNAPQRHAPAAAPRLRESERLSAAALGAGSAAAGSVGSARGARCPRPARVATAREPSGRSIELLENVVGLSS
jgi:hypothetical protein